MNSRIGILVCDLLAVEFQTVIRNEGWEDVDILPLKASCLPGNGPRVTPRPHSLPKGNLEHDWHLVGCPAQMEAVITGPGGDTITGHVLPNCLQALMPQAAVDQLTGSGGYLVTSGWLSGWRKHMKKMKFTREIAREFFGEFAKQVVLIDTGVRPEAAEDCRKFAAYLDLPWQTIPVGLDQAALYLRDIVQGVRLTRLAEEVKQTEFKLNEARANCLLMLEIQSDLSSLRDESEVVKKIHEMFTLLFSPRDLVVVSCRNGDIVKAWPGDIPPETARSISSDLADESRPDLLTAADGKGTLLSFGSRQRTSGAVWFSGFHFPENRDEYLNQAVALAPVCKLVIDRSRALQGIVPVCSYCHHIRDNKGSWHKFESFISDRSEALFSHTLCPDCFEEKYSDLADDSEDQV